MNKKLSIAAIASFLMILLLQWQGSLLKTSFSPRGIIDLEFADTPQRLHELLMGWKISMVKINIWLDFLFIVCYVILLSLASEISALKWQSSFMRQIGLVMARLAYLAGVLDIAENLLMLQSIYGNFTSASLQLTYYCALVKFMIAGIILIYLLISLPILLRNNKN